MLLKKFSKIQKPPKVISFAKMYKRGEQKQKILIFKIPISEEKTL